MGFRYIIRGTKDKRRTNLRDILKIHGIKQYELAQSSGLENWQISAPIYRARMLNRLPYLNRLPVGTRLWQSTNTVKLFNSRHFPD